MRLRKGIAILTILSLSNLFAVDLNSINMLVEKINNSKEVAMVSQLMKQLDTELLIMDDEDLPKAQELVNRRLRITAK